MGVAIEDDTFTADTIEDNSGAYAGYTQFGGEGSAAIGVAGRIEYTGDTFSGSLNGVYHHTDNSTGGVQQISWTILTSLDWAANSSSLT